MQRIEDLETKIRSKDEQIMIIEGKLRLAQD
jgi:hypothetical protein